MPANRPDRFPKAAATEADAIILDLEDAVPASEKEAARTNLTTGFTEKPVIQHSLVHLSSIQIPANTC